MEDLIVCAEEAFFERYFEYGDDDKANQANLKAALDVYFRSYRESSAYAEQITDGEVVDGPSVTLALQNMIFAYKYAERFRKALGYDGPALDISSLDLSAKSSQELAKEGTVLITKSPFNVQEFEKGQYMLFVAMNS